MINEVDNNTIKNTALYNIHKMHNAKIVNFAGYRMPLYYTQGAIKEHLHTRNKSGLFDVSHMGQILFDKSSSINILEKLIPVDLINLPIGRQAYGLLLNENAGIVDDLIISNYEKFFHVVVNASCYDKDIAFFNQYFADANSFTTCEARSLLALQGPSSESVLSSILPEVATMKFMDCKIVVFDQEDCFISRSGYTGEDGFEISAPNNIIEKIATNITNHADVNWCGLVARDSLRLEAGLCLYGNDIDENRTPIVANLSWAIAKNRRINGSRPGGFNGADIILNNKQDITDIRVGLISDSRIPVRQGCVVIDNNDNTIGTITSGNFSPSLNTVIAMANIKKSYAKINQDVYVKIRKHKIPMKVCKMPFITKKYKQKS